MIARLKNGSLKHSTPAPPPSKRANIVVPLRGGPMMNNSRGFTRPPSPQDPDHVAVLYSTNGPQLISGAPARQRDHTAGTTHESNASDRLTSPLCCEIIPVSGRASSQAERT
jgi:hypothetical protein